MKILCSYLGVALLATFLLVPVLAAHADLVVVAPTGSSTGSLTITQDVTFTITTAVSSGTDLRFALDNWVTYDGATFQVTYSPLIPLSKNGGPAQTYGSGEFIDNFGNNFSVTLTPGDGFFRVANGPALAINDTLTLKAGSYTLGESATDGFNPQATQTFTGNMFVFTGDTRVSNSVAVPEPGSALFLGIGLSAGLGTIRRRRSAT